MIFRKISLFLSKYIAISLCVITLLLTTPWGTQLTLSLINTLDSIEFDYQSGSLVRDIQLNSFHLKLDNLDIKVKRLSTEFDFSCVWKKTLCIKSAKADYFSLSYEDIVPLVTEENKLNNQHVEIPFSIDADSIEIKESQLFFNKDEISINQFSSQFSIHQSEFYFLKPKAKQLTVILEEDEQKAPLNSKGTENQNPISLVHDIIAKLPEINLPIALIIEQLHVDSIVIETKKNQKGNCQPNCLQWLSSNNQVSGKWVNADVSISHFNTTTPFFSVKEFTAEAKLKPPYEINSHFVSQLKEIAWWPEIANTTQKISLQGSLEDLAYNIISKGSLTFTSQGKVNLVHKNMPFNVKVDAQKIPMPLSLSSYGTSSSLSFKFSGDVKEQAIDLTSQLNSYGYNNAHVKLIATHHQRNFNIKKLHFNDTGSASQLDLHGGISILPADINWKLSANSTGFSLPKISLRPLIQLSKDQEKSDWLALNMPDTITGRLEGKIGSTGRLSEKEWFITLDDTDIVGEINKSYLIFNADIGLNQSGHLKQGNLFIDFNNSQLTLHAEESGFWDINGQLSVNNLNHWHHEINGGFISDFSVTGEENNPKFEAETQFSELNWQHWYSSFLEIDVSYQPMNNHDIQLTLENDQLKWVKESKSFSIDNFNLNVEGDAHKHHIETKWLGDFTGQLVLTGHWDDTFTHWQSSVKQSVLAYQNITLKNDKKFDLGINLVKQEAVVENHCWHGDGLAFCLPNQATIGHSGELAAEINIDLSTIDGLFLPEEIELISQVDGVVDVKWSTQQPIEANANFSLSSGFIKVSDDFSEHQLSTWSKGLFTFSIDEQQLTSSIQLIKKNNLPLINISSTVNFIDNDIPLDDYPLNAKIVLNQFNLQPFESILTNILNFQGYVNANISVDGTVNAPSINGDISLEKGRFLMSKNANIFDNISSSITINNNQASLDGRFYIQDKEAKLQGNIAWQDKFTMNMDLTADVLPLVFPPQFIASISPTINFSLIDKSLMISGNIDVLEGTYNIEKLSDNSVSLSDDVIIINEGGQVVIKESSDFDIKTNISVNIEKAFQVEGQGLQSHLFGKLQIKQQEKHPFQLFGRIQSSDGIYQAYGQKLKIEKGELTFNGPINNPYFNLRASRHIKAEDIDVGIQIIGLADTLDMKLFSTPTMEMPEMLSYLVRGRSLDTGTENSTAAASLLVGFGVTNSVGLFEQIEKIPLISNIAVDTEGEGEKTQATVSGYVGNRIYLKYGIGVYEPINELTVRMFLFNRLWLEIVSGIEQSTDLYYSFDID